MSTLPEHLHAVWRAYERARGASAISTGQKDNANMIKTILVPTGGSDTDFVVFETALAVAQLFRAHLEFFHARVDAAEGLRYSPHATFACGRGVRNALDDLERELQARSRAGKQHFQNFCKHNLKVTDMRHTPIC
jgi:hypothetical protein